MVAFALFACLAGYRKDIESLPEVPPSMMLFSRRYDRNWLLGEGVGWVNVGEILELLMKSQCLSFEFVSYNMKRQVIMINEC